MVSFIRSVQASWVKIFGKFQALEKLPAENRDESIIVDAEPTWNMLMKASGNALNLEAARE